MNFKIGEDIVCINGKFRQVYGKPSEFAHPKKGEIVTVSAFKEHWIQLEQYPLNNDNLPLFFSQDRFRKLIEEDFELTESYEESAVI